MVAHFSTPGVDTVDFVQIDFASDRGGEGNTCFEMSVGTRCPVALLALNLYMLSHNQSLSLDGVLVSPAVKPLPKMGARSLDTSVLAWPNQVGKS